MIRYDMDSNLRVTFAAKEGLAAKSVCKVCGSGTVGPCSDGDDFCGVADTVRGGRCGVVLRGFVTVPYSLPAPALGYVGVAADSTGGIKAAQSGRKCLVVGVDTVKKTVDLLL